MSFAVWNDKPRFDEADLNPAERIYQVGNKWVVTDQGNPTQGQIDAVLNPPVPKSKLDLVIEYIASKSDAPLELKALAAAAAESKK